VVIPAGSLEGVGALGFGITIREVIPSALMICSMILALFTHGKDTLEKVKQVKV
jgi:hypothetical protein